MIFVATLADGRKLRDQAAQVTVSNGLGELIMLAYYGPAGCVVAGHYREREWDQFLIDAGTQPSDRLAINGRVDDVRQLFTRVLTVGGKALVMPTRRTLIYSDAGDPVAAAIASTDGPPLVAHCADEHWKKFIKKHEIHQPRDPEIIEV